MANGKKRSNPYANEQEPKLRVQLSIEKRQVEWLKRHSASPSRILREAINTLMEREQKLLGEK